MDAESTHGTKGHPSQASPVWAGEATAGVVPPPLGRLRLDGKVAFVTGASRTVGLGVALALARAGADIAAIGVETDELKQLARLVGAQGVRVCTIASDMLNEDEIAASLTSAVDSLGQIDVVVHSAEGCSFNAPYLGGRNAELANRVEASLVGAARLCEHVGRHVATFKTSSLVIVAAPTNLRPWPDIAARAAGLALLELTKTLAQEWAPDGVRINAITPGPVPKDHPYPTDGEPLQPPGVSMPLGRRDSHTSVIDAVLWLASDGARYVTGAHIPLDGAENLVVSEEWQLLLSKGPPGLRLMRRRSLNGAVG
jgi:NAD(P)-dependent dehydrogenase (short-subunit alcohol dehydrogenase family)